jgi:hypothetical protein
MSEILSLSRMSRRAGVTQHWLRHEAEAGRVPCLRVGKRLLFSPPAVLEALAVLASRKTHDRNGVEHD